jgi:hypothetical protein
MHAHDDGDDLEAPDDDCRARLLALFVLVGIGGILGGMALTFALELLRRL